MAKKKAVRKSKKKPARHKKPVRRKKPARKKKLVRKKSSAGRVAVSETFEVELIGGVGNAPEDEDAERATDEEPLDDDFPPDYGGSE